MKEVLIELEEGAKVPTYGTEDAAGADVRAYLTEDKVLVPGSSTLIPTGIKVEIPKGYEIQVRPRSGLALKHGITVLNTPGTIDSDYRGPVGVILINHSKEAFTVEPNMRIAQLILAPVAKATFVRKEKLSQTLRDEGGFGHTGLA
jgi:dUTP pyrophosphatase